jgi:hypothetical protein
MMDTGLVLWYNNSDHTANHKAGRFVLSGHYNPSNLDGKAPFTSIGLASPGWLCGNNSDVCGGRFAMKTELCARCNLIKKIKALGLCSSCYKKCLSSGDKIGLRDGRYSDSYGLAVCAYKPCSKIFRTNLKKNTRKYCSQRCSGIGRRVIDEEKSGEIIKLYSDGMSARAIGKCISVSDNSVTNFLSANDIPIRSNWSYREKYPIDYSLFDSIDNEISSYWLGFIYADGYCSNGVSVLLSRKDTAHLELLRDALSPSRPVFERASNGISLVVSSKRLSKTMLDLGIVVGRGNFEVLKAQLSPNHYRDFIRGYLDGDGYITKTDTLYTPNVGFIGQTDILVWIQDNIRDVSGYPCLQKIIQRHGIREVSFGGRYQIKAILSYLYNGATVSLDRKRARAEYWMGL